MASVAGVVEPTSSPIVLPTTGYVPALDGFRAIAILFVLAAHFTHWSFIPGGFGVTLFFFISGFLITRLLIAELGTAGRIDLPRFYARRFLRLAPALLVMVALVSITAVATGRKAPPMDIVAAVFYFANYYRIFVGFTLTFGLLWSLAVEEHYYLVFPAILGPIFRSSRPLVILTGLVAAALVWRISLMAVIHPPADYTYMATDARFDSILYGAILAVWMSKTPDLLSKPVLTSLPAFGVGVIVILATFVLKSAFLRETIRYSAQGLALMPIVAAITFSDKARIYGFARSILSSAPATFIGKLSYSLYLWHYVFIDGVTSALPRLKPIVALPIAFVLAIVASLISYYGVERSFVKLRRRFGSHAG
jgi:peptidoglycan/LPS O-acetylase OafA/YrhL